ncbi:hypothetical protein DSM104440_00849 [Usitatibacter palustris]|uniref:Uncharacterized protein n=2 Tax=Usitatibacter palustris TaxID=2732487 RepID=A0A6M4H7T8_9PROT|nr:hypothetical protein DSM104440_00849 [Usitatibacter palustris]
MIPFMRTLALPRKAISLIATLVVAAALSLTATSARAGCGTIHTANMTPNWTWVTIYDLGKTIQLDYGWVAPHSIRSWTAGASPLFFACGSFYYVRGEVHTATGPKPDGGVKIFDTTVQLNPQLRNWPDLVISALTDGLTCMGTAGACAVKWGLKEGVKIAALGADSFGSATCLHSNDGKNFWWTNSDQCLPTTKPPPPPPPPPPPKYSLGDTRRVGVGYNTESYQIKPRVVGSYLVSMDERRKGKWTSLNPAIVSMEKFGGYYDGHFRALKAGKATITWEYKGQKASVVIDVQGR